MATQGTIIRALDYNNVQTAVAKLLGTGVGNFGYGQNVISSPVIQNATIVDNAHLAYLKTEILKIATHAGIETNALITALPSPSDQSLILAEQIAAFENAIPLLNNNRFELASSQASIENFVPNITQTRTTAWGTMPNNTIRHSFTIDFGTANNARYFFNSGGSIRFKPSRTSGSVTSQNQAWSNLLDAIGIVSFKHNITSASGSGTGSSIGFYQLTNTLQQVYTKTGSGTYIAAYNNNNYTIRMSCDVSNNTTGGARYIYVTAEFNDTHVTNLPVYAYLYDIVNGTLTHEVTLRRASGSNVDVIAPTAVNTVLLSN